MKMVRRRAVEAAPVVVDGAAHDDELALLLVGQRVVQPHEVDAAQALPGDAPLAERLVATGALTEGALARTLAAHHAVELVDLGARGPSPDAPAFLRGDVARELRALPLEEDGDVLVVAFLHPAPALVEQVRAAVDRPVRPVVAQQRALTRALDTAYAATRDVGSQVQAFEARDALRREASSFEAASASEDAPVVRVVQMILTQALRDRASDVHIEPFGDRVRVRYRVDGALNDVLDLPGSIGPALVSRVKILAELNIVERRRPQDGQISLELEGREVDIRVSTTSVVGGEKVVMRLLDKSRPLFRLAQLGMPEDTRAAFARHVRSPYGMVICAGPTGGGKTTTLYASLGELDSPERNLMTIEDPVEYTFDSINQIQINEQAGVTFANGLRSILRQDPDVILVGEIRDVETARIAVQSALTGHLVLSSLHATESVSALYRLLDMGIEGFLIASSVTAVMAQRLVRRTCTSCAAPHVPTAEELGFLRSCAGHDLQLGRLTKGTGCTLCNQTGFLDRVGVYELLEITDELRELIVERAPHDQIRKVAEAQGMRTLQEQAARLVLEGTTTAAEVVRSIYVGGQ